MRAARCFERINEPPLRSRRSRRPGQAVVDTDRTRAKARDLKQSACDHDVLKEMDHLILVGEVAVKRHCSRQAEKRQRDRDEAGLEAGDQQQFTAKLDDNGHREGERRRGQADCADHLGRWTVSAELLRPLIADGRPINRRRANGDNG